MRRGCISLGEIQCHGCQRIIPQAERYLATNEEEEKTTYYCVDCTVERGYASYKEEKGERVLTFLP